MGSARLTVLRPERSAVGPDGRPSSSCGHPQGLHEKRVLVHGKTKGEVLLDAQLGESCFERVARTGIAVSVWEDVGLVPAVGGVAGGRAKVYMVQVCVQWRKRNRSTSSLTVITTVEKRSRNGLHFLPRWKTEVLGNQARPWEEPTSDIMIYPLILRNVGYQAYMVFCWCERDPLLRAHWRLFGGSIR